MIVKDLFARQQELDDYILDNLNTRTYNKLEHEDLLNERCLALLVEVGEFMEEQDREKKLTEAIDCLHFLLSIANTLEVKMSYDYESFDVLYQDYDTSKHPEYALSKFYINITKLMNYRKSFKYWQQAKIYNPETISIMYKRAFTSFLTLCNAHYYTANQIESAYINKYAENIRRQEVGY